MTKHEFDERLTTIQIYYYIPDYQSLLQEFTWQFVDYQPEFSRAHQFLAHWQQHVEARIHTIYLAHIDLWGTKTSEETKKKIGSKHKGKKISDEQKQQLSEFNKGKKVSPETREKIRQTLLMKNAEKRSK